MATAPRVAPARPTSTDIAMNARPVPNTPSATMARRLGHENVEPGAWISPNGATRATATSWARNTTGRAPYFCWRGTAMFAASPYRTVADRAITIPTAVPVV